MKWCHISAILKVLILYFNSWKLHEVEFSLSASDGSIIACSFTDRDVAVYILVPELWVLLELYVVILITLFSDFK